MISFSRDTAAKIGVSRSTIEQELKIANKLDESVKGQIRHTPLADNKVELLKLARLAPAQQKEIVEEITYRLGSPPQSYPYSGVYIAH